MTAARFCFTQSAPLRAGDGVHLALCQRLNLQLASFDRGLCKAAAHHQEAPSVRDPNLIRELEQAGCDLLRLLNRRCGPLSEATTALILIQALPDVQDPADLAP